MAVSAPVTVLEKTICPVAFGVSTVELAAMAKVVFQTVVAVSAEFLNVPPYTEESRLSPVVPISNPAKSKMPPLKRKPDLVPVSALPIVHLPAPAKVSNLYLIGIALKLASTSPAPDWPMTTLPLVVELFKVPVSFSVLFTAGDKLK